MRTMWGWLVGGCLLAAPAWAQSPAPPVDPPPELTSDRPGFNAPASVVGAGVVQIELGWSTVRTGDGSHASIAPQPLLRIGVADDVEVQVTSPGLAAQCVADCDWHGTDVAVASRVHLPMQPLGLDLAATALVSLPTGSAAVSSQHVDPLLVLHAEHPLGASVDLSYNYLVTRIHDEDEARASVRHGHGLALGSALGKWSPFLAVAWRPEHVDGKAPMLAQAGSGYRLGRDVQIDVTVDRGLNAAEPSWGISAGLVLRHRPR